MQGLCSADLMKFRKRRRLATAAALAFLQSGVLAKGKVSTGDYSDEHAPPRPVNTGIWTAGNGVSAADVMGVRDYLTQYGYMQQPRFLFALRRIEKMENTEDLTDSSFDREIGIALKRFQRIHGISETGKLDVLTRNVMAMPRCGMPDWNDPLGALEIGGWKKRQLTYCFSSLSRQSPAPLLREAVNRAFATWTATPSVKISFREITNPNIADISVAWVQASDRDRSLVGTKVAHADFPPGYSLIAKSPPLPLHFDDEETVWSVDGTGMDMETIALHEIGHCLGLIHSADAQSIMYPTVTSRHIATALSDGDVKAVKILYA